MSTTDKRTVNCGTHGDVGPAFVCCHLIRDELAPAGFNEAELEPDDPEPMAWCNACETMIDETGGWTEQAEKFADIKLVCEFCFARLRVLHSHAA